MKRRDFLKRFGIGAAAVVAAPSIVKAALPDDLHGVTTIGDMSYPEDGIIQSGSLTTDFDAEFAMHEEMDRRLFLGEHYNSAYDDAQRIAWEKKHWPKLVKRYGNVNIVDFLNITS